MLDIFQSGGPANLARGTNPADPGKNPMVARFSTVAAELGAADAERDVRGFALEFHTEEQLGSRRQRPLEVINIPYGTTRRKLQNAMGEKNGRKD
jgi:hypothetical protein